MGFLPDMKRIIKEVPGNRQTLLFSATLPKSIIRLAERWLSDPIEITVSPKTPTVEKISQSVCHVPQHKKQALLTRWLLETRWTRTLVFTRTKHGADKLVRKLLKAGIDADAFHGNKTQNVRQRVLDRFKSSSSAGPHRYRYRRAWIGRGRRQPRRQLRSSRRRRKLHPPHRPHRPRRGRRFSPFRSAIAKSGASFEKSKRSRTANSPLTTGPSPSRKMHLPTKFAPPKSIAEPTPQRTETARRLPAPLPSRNGAATESPPAAATADPKPEPGRSREHGVSRDRRKKPEQGRTREHGGNRDRRRKPVADRRLVRGGSLQRHRRQKAEGRSRGGPCGCRRDRVSPRPGRPFEVSKPWRFVSVLSKGCCRRVSNWWEWIE